MHADVRFVLFSLRARITLFSNTSNVGMAKLFQIPTVAGVTKATAKQQMLKQLQCTDAPEQALRYHGYSLIAGVDEVGRGAIFGPVVAAAVVLPPKCGVLARMGLKDSKQLTRDERERLDRKIRQVALAIGIAEIDAATIDRVNIYHATRLAMLRAVNSLSLTPDHIILDAMLIDHPCPQTKLFYGDALCRSVAAASVVAKVHRDALLRTLDTVYPAYGLAQHKGYGTPEHRKALAEQGPSPLHRLSFNLGPLPDRASVPDAAVYAPDLQDEASVSGDFESLNGSEISESSQKFQNAENLLETSPTKNKQPNPAAHAQSATGILTLEPCALGTEDAA